MHGTRLLAAGAVAALCALPAATALAYLQEGAAGVPDQSLPAYTMPQRQVKLSPIVVSGQRMPLPIALQLIRAALGRPWSSARADRNEMVCRFQMMLGSHLQALRCETNAQHQRVAERTQAGLFEARAETSAGCDLFCSLTTKAPPIAVIRYVDSHPISRGAMEKLLKKLPPPGSSYTLRITQDGKPVIEYVIRHGKVSRVYVTRARKQAGGP